MTEAEQRLIDVALLMAQELQEYVDVAIDCEGSNSAELATQELLKDWEEAYAACELTEEDHFQEARAAADRITPWRYPPDMPEDGQRIVHTYEQDRGESAPIVDVYNKVYYEAYCRQIVRWMAIPEV